jgi:hypothetical protein
MEAFVDGDSYQIVGDREDFDDLTAMSVRAMLRFPDPITA